MTAICEDTWMLSVSGHWRDLVGWTSDRITTPLLSALQVPANALGPRELAPILLIAVIQIGIILLVFRPLESWLPAERWTDRRLTRVDIQYTLLLVLGIVPLTIVLAMNPLRDVFGGDASSPGDPRTGLLHAIPVLDQHPYLMFFVYYVVFDFVYYWMHRAQHAIPWWWALHSLHHSQRQVSCWTNDRGSFLVDGLLQVAILGCVGVVLGVNPSEFALLMLLAELIQNFSHTNVRIGFGWLLNRVFVGPAFHRLHHMRFDPRRPGLHRCNFAQAFPVWDILFGTALYDEPLHATGVTDPVVDADNGRGLFGQQWAAIQRFWGAIWRRAGWVLGDVSFGAGYEPIPDARATSRELTVNIRD